MESFDAIIIGAGSAGLGCLGMAKTLGWKACIIDKNEANIGGDCLNFGCVPSKALIHIAKQFYGARQAQNFGLDVQGKADWQKVISSVYEKQAIIRAHESAEYLRSNGEFLIIGEAKFVDAHTVEVNGEQYYGKKIFICTGSHPRHIPFEGLDMVKHFNNETLFYDLKTLPDRFLVVGGGPIGCEMAQVFQRLGSKVTIVNRGDRILSKERPELSEILHAQLEKEGIEIWNQYYLTKFEESNRAILTNRENQETKTLEFDACLIAIGRGLNHGSLDVEKAGIELTEKGALQINDHLQTTVDHIYAVGDAVGTYQFSHGAELHVRLLRYNFSHIIKKKHNIEGLSWVTFTDPEVATFGLSEEQLKEKKINYWRQEQFFDHDDRAITSDYRYGKIILLVSTNNNKMKRKIYGGSIIAPNAGEIMQELHLAVVAGINLGDIMDKVYAYPTASRINQQTIQGIVEYEG